MIRDMGNYTDKYNVCTSMVTTNMLWRYAAYIMLYAIQRIIIIIVDANSNAIKLTNITARPLMKFVHTKILSFLIKLCWIYIAIKQFILSMLNRDEHLPLTAIEWSSSQDAEWALVTESL